MKDAASADESSAASGSRPPAALRFMVPWRPDFAKVAEGQGLNQIGFPPPAPAVGMDGWRDPLWTFTRAQWERDFPGIPIIEGASPDGPFNRSAAINDAARGDWDVGIIIDADVVCNVEQVSEAVSLSLATGRLVLPFTLFKGLTPHMTYRALQGETEGWGRGVRYVSDRHESSVVVVPRSVWDAVKGFDERFVGWGQEDVAFVQSVRLMCGEPLRVEGIVWHLWHPRGPDRLEGSPLWWENQKRGDRYREATTKDDILALLGERRNGSCRKV